MACLCLWCLLCFPIRKLPEQLSAASPPSSPCTKQFHWRFLVFIFLVVMQHWILPLTLHVGLWWVVTEVQLSFCIVWFGVLLTDLFTCLFCLDKACNLHNSSAPPPPSRRPTAFKVCPDYDLLPPVEGEFFCILLLFSALFFISLSIVFTFEQVRRLDSTTSYQTLCKCDPVMTADVTWDEHWSGRSQSIILWLPVHWEIHVPPFKSRSNRKLLLKR